jgi:hypothetical protein
MTYASKTRCSDLTGLTLFYTRVSFAFKNRERKFNYARDLCKRVKVRLP